MHTHAPGRQVVARKASLAALVGLLAASSVLASPPAQSDAPGAPATVRDYEPPMRIESYPMIDLGRKAARVDDREGKTKWRIVERTGNCCENYLTSTPQGRLLDFGGTFINFTDDDGKTWKQVAPTTPLVNGEGAIAIAPNGDVLGVGWDPYSGDHLQSFKYETATESWQWLEMPLHTPFYDREWIAVVPGPFTDRTGAKVPYVTFVRGGYPTKETWLYSTDGLTYVQASSTYIDQSMNEPVESTLKVAKDKSFDWIHSNTNMGVTPLGGGRALAAPDWGSENWAILDPETLTWHAFSFPDGEPNGRYLSDSRGRLHNLRPASNGFVYRISADGGKSWKETSVELPEGLAIEEIDFRANAAAGVAAVGIHAHDGTDGADQDLVIKLDITRSKPRAARVYFVGLGDVDGSSGVGQDIRFDFETVTILPDGRIAVSFYDTTTAGVYHLQEAINPDRIGPALAIELSTKL